MTWCPWSREPLILTFLFWTVWYRFVLKVFLRYCKILAPQSLAETGNKSWTTNLITYKWLPQLFISCIGLILLVSVHALRYRTALMYACLLGLNKSVSLLLKRGASSQLLDNNGHTGIVQILWFIVRLFAILLHILIMQKCLGCARLLVPSLHKYPPLKIFQTFSKNKNGRLEYDVYNNIYPQLL